MLSDAATVSSEGMVDSIIEDAELEGDEEAQETPPPPHQTTDEEFADKNPLEQADEGPLPLTPEAIIDTTPIVSTFKDHFTLPIPSSVVRYRNLHSAARILEAGDAQFVLEDLYDPDTKTRHVSIRRIHDTSEGVRALRLLYAIVT
jgi:hypothetical protein